jgi:hypothetical protein
MMRVTGSDIMAAIGFTTTTSRIKEQSETATAKGLEAYGVSVIEDGDGKHDVIKASNAQLHLFMQMKRGNIQSMIFQEPEQVGIFMDNIIGYYGEEKARRVMEPVRFIAVSGCEGEMGSRGLEVFSSFESFEAALDSLC